MNRSDVLIVGAGPTGLVLALWLSKLGIRVRILDKTSAPGTTSRALAVQARTLELYRQLDLSDAVVRNGHRVGAANFWVKGEPVARLPLTRIGEGLTPYAFLEIFPQDEHERLLIERLEKFGVEVERNTELESFEDTGDGISVRLRLPDGQQEVCQACYLAGCDGARSMVRKTLDTGFPGGTYQQIFYVADVQARGPTFNGELHVDLDEADFLAVFPLAGEGRARLIGTVRDERADRVESLQFEDVSSRAIEHMNVQIDQVNWFSTYRVHHRVADHFRSGRAFLLGDAAHVHSPAGGQGMNTGIGDAINLAWKLKAVLRGEAQDGLLDSYEAERLAFARTLVDTTDRVFTFVSAEGSFANFVRTRIAPLFVSAAYSVEAVREFMFRVVSQCMPPAPPSTTSRRPARSAGRCTCTAAPATNSRTGAIAPAWRCGCCRGSAPTRMRGCSATPSTCCVRTAMWRSRMTAAGRRCSSCTSGSMVTCASPSSVLDAAIPAWHYSCSRTRMKESAA
jgi:2-polyprenyl-6-methoxyphenol hydroxylase-like FAD-dependent oxidoreductase